MKPYFSWCIENTSKRIECEWSSGVWEISTCRYLQSRYIFSNQISEINFPNPWLGEEVDNGIITHTLSCWKFNTRGVVTQESFGFIVHLRCALECGRDGLFSLIGTVNTIFNFFDFKRSQSKSGSTFPLLKNN